MRRVRKSVAQRYYQLLSGHAAMSSFLHDRMSGPQRLETDECWWCRCVCVISYLYPATCSLKGYGSGSAAAEATAMGFFGISTYPVPDRPSLS